MSSDVESVLRRLKPDKRREPLTKRSGSELPFAERASRLPRALLYDTTVYVDILQDRFPHRGEVAIRVADAWHSTVTEAELIAPCGFLNPDHPETSNTVKGIVGAIERRPAHRTIAPDREIWLVAGVLSGILARLQGYGRAERRRALNDALIFATARKHGMTVLTRNTDDFDLLQQLDPGGQVLFYERL
ncbi:MAG TPA: PIN domain-containing protein [Terriglobales bacterium]|nr:PIN domain-containing protein [Terriglobales bacterium]